MNRHSYTVLEFDKLREEISNYSAIEENHYKILGLEPFKDFSSLNRELDVLRDFTDFLKFDWGIRNCWNERYLQADKEITADRDISGCGRFVGYQS